MILQRFVVLCFLSAVRAHTSMIWDVANRRHYWQLTMPAKVRFQLSDRSRCAPEC